MKDRLDESIEKLQDKLMPPTQMAYKGRTTTSALLYIDTIIRAAWKAGKVVSILSLDMSGAFNSVNCQKLIELLYQRGIPEGLVKMTSSSLSYRRTTIRIPSYTSEEYNIDRGVPQGSPLSGLLFLLYTAPLLEDLSKPDSDKTSQRFVVAFADDTYVIRVSDQIPENCDRLTADFKICEEWAHKYDMSFGRHKLEVMNFSRSPKDSAYLKCKPNIPGFDREANNPKGMKVLGIIFDPELSWDLLFDHFKHEKFPPLWRIGKRILGPEIGLPLSHARQFIVQVVVASIAHACAVWFLPEGPCKLTDAKINSLRKGYRPFLRLIEGAYRSTKCAFLYREVGIYQMDIELGKRAAVTLAKMYRMPIWRVIDDARDKILGASVWDPCNGLSDTFEKRCQDADILFQQSQARSEEIWRGRSTYLTAQSLAPTQEDREQCHLRAMKLQVDAIALETTEKAWEMEREGYDYNRHVPVTVLGEWDVNIIDMHIGLTRLESIALIRLRTETIRLRSYLYKIGQITDDYCACDRGRQTVYHVLLECPLLASARTIMLEIIGRDFNNWLGKLHGPRVAKWALKNVGLIEPDWMLRTLSGLDPDAV